MKEAVAIAGRYSYLLRRHWFARGVLNSYGQVFFSNHPLFAVLLAGITFIDFYTGLFGLIALLTAQGTATALGMERYMVQQGYYGFNALLTGMGMGLYYQSGALLLLLVVLAGLLALLLAVVLQGVIGKYGLPHLSLPFILSLWILMLASREFGALGLNERGVYTLNDLYVLGGKPLVDLYQWWNALPIAAPIKTYLLSLSAIFFHYSVLAGLLVAVGLLFYSRIAFSLSLLGFFTAWLFYGLIGAQITETGYSYIGFNYILTAIATGGFFVIPSRWSYVAVVLLIPMVALLTISSAKVLAVVGLPVYSLPFNVIVLAFLYVLQFRTNTTKTLQTYFVQYNAPEKNFYAFSNYVRRFGQERKVAIHLPFHGEWEVTQAYDGPYTHKGDWKYAWDFEIRDEAGKTYRNDGDYAEDYYCFGKVILAPADGTVETVLDGIEDNIVGRRNLEYNWGNTVVLQHGPDLYSKLSHLKQGSILVKPGDKVRKGDPVAQCGNSGNSPYPHLHFQLQATPYIGSKTLRYPVSHLYLQRGGKRQMWEQAEPQTGDRVMNVQPHPSLRAAFYLVNGQQFCWKDAAHPEQLIRWEVATDTYLNKYILCKATGSRAYFKVLDTMLYFTHFEGNRQSLLYRFYLAAHKISFGFERGMQLTDHIALNRVFTARQLWLHDFVAPFFQYLDAVYTIQYPDVANERLLRELKLTGKVAATRLGKTTTELQFTLQVDAEGLQAFTFLSPHYKTEAVCVKDSVTY